MRALFELDALHGGQAGQNGPLPAYEAPRVHLPPEHVERHRAVPHVYDQHVLRVDAYLLGNGVGDAVQVAGAQVYALYEQLALV